MAKKTKNDTTVEDLKAPLLAAVGAADLALATVNEILSSLRERAELAGDRMEDRRAALTRLQEELPKRTEELRGRLPRSSSTTPPTPTPPWFSVARPRWSV